MNNNDDTISYNDAAMRIILQPLADEELRQFDEYNKRPHEFLEDYKRKVNKMFRLAQIRCHLIDFAVWGRRVAVAVMIIATTILASCAVIKPLREKISGAILEWYEEYVSVLFEENSDEPTMKMPMYIPDGYELWSDVSLNNHRVLCYENDAGDLLKITCRPSEIASNLDYERHSFTEITIGQSKGIYFADEERSDNMIIWTANGFTYSINSCLELNELKQIAENMK